MEVAYRLLPADQLGQRYGKVSRHPCWRHRARRRWRDGDRAARRRWGEQRRVLRQDRPVEGDQLGTGIHAQLVGELPTESVVAVQRLTLSARAIQHPQMQGTQALPVRVVGQQVGELPAVRVVLAEGEPGLGPVLDGGQPLLRKPGGQCRGERGLGEVGQHRAPPQPERLVEERGPVGRGGGVGGPLQQGREPFGVGRLRARPEQVARRVGEHAVAGAGGRGVQGTAQSPDLRLQCPGRVGWWPVRPHLLAEPVDRHRLPLVGQQGGEQEPDLQIGHGDRCAVRRPDTQRTEEPEAHGGTVAQGPDNGP